MKHVLIVLGILFLSLGCDTGRQDSSTAQMSSPTNRESGQTSQPASLPDKQEEMVRAKTAIQAFAGELQAQLTSAMKAGGPVAAIGVCKSEAMPITARVAEQHGLKLHRVSLRYRNPANAPNVWQTAVLEDFERRKSAGEDPASISWAEFTDAGSDREFRMMKAIPTVGICLQCHGTEIAPEVSEALAALYPEDLATGFQEGDLRGAFVVTRNLPGDL